MPAHSSLLPGENKTHNVRFDDSGGSLSWRGWRIFLSALAAVLVGSGGFVGFQFVTRAEMQQAMAVTEQRQDEKLVPIREEASSIKARISTVSDTLDNVRDFQIRQSARQEARRVTDTLADRAIREREYDRLLELNERRLLTGKEPCGNISCSN